MPELKAGTVQVWWAGPGDARPGHLDLLDADELDRHGALRRAEDRDRFVVGCALTKLAAAAQLGINPAAVRLRRTCDDCGKPHGKPRLPGTGLELSLSHSGGIVVLAVARETPVGIDVERVDRRLDPELMRDHVFGDGEVLATEPAAFITVWARKEAALKATGEGLRVPLRDVVVTAADERARLLSWTGRPDAPARIHLTDLDAGVDHRACLATIGPAAPVVLEQPAVVLLEV